MERSMLLLIIAVTLLVCVSCEKKVDKNINDEIEITEHQGMTIIEEVGMKNVFSSLRINISSGNGFYNANYFDRSFTLNERVYFAIEYLNPEIRYGYTFTYMYSYDFNGEDEEYTLINPVDEDAEIKFAWYDSEYNLIIIEELEYKYTMTKFLESGEILFSFEINDIINNSTIISMVIGDADNNIYIASSDNTVTVLSKEGKVIWQITPHDTVLQLSSAHGKTPIVRMRGEGNMISYQYIALENNTLLDIEMPHNTYFYMYSYVMYGEEYDYYHVNQDGVYGYDIASNTLTKVLDWNNSDLIFSQLRMFVPLSPVKMLMGNHDLSDYKYKLYILNHIPNDEIPDKTYISIGYINALNDSYLNQVVADFNKYSDEYRITLTNYYSRNGSLDPMLRLNNEIAAGNTPDIMYINSYIPILTYTKNNLFVNLYDYLADESELSSNLLPFVTKSVEINGVLPQMVTKFTIKTLLGKSKNLGNDIGWSISDMMEMYKTLPDDVTLTYELSQTFLKNYVLDNVISKCVDYNGGTCDFNQQGFRDYIELYGLLPEYFDYWSVGDQTEFTKDNYAKCRNDEMLLSSVLSIGNVLTYMNGKRLNFRDEEVNVIGFPTMNGDTSGDYIDATGFSILSTSENKEGGWEFIKFCLSDTFAERSSSLFVMIPTNTAINIYNDWFEGQQIFYSDFDLTSSYVSGSVEDIESRYGSGMLDKVDDRWIAEFNSYINTIDNYVYKNQSISDIVNEEVLTYVNSSKSIDDTIKAIQSRVSIYMSETWR